MEFKLHDVEWTDEKVARFWDSFSKMPQLQYFAQQVGRKVIRFSSKYIDLKTNILDYGSGKGFLIDYLLQYGAKNVSGCDFSEGSVKYVSNKFADNKNFKECIQIKSLPSELPSNHYECVFFMETIEHLLEAHYEPTLKEINRIVKKGGYVIITTRNEENLDNLKVICPDCGGMFHRVQHVRSFSRENITETMSKFGFQKELCESKDLGRSEIIRTGVEFYRWIKKLQHLNPNLIYIGKKV
ncbi:MAG TPA: methyltransferase domain-containing protein [Flavobacterium sp.]|nr:methyltransferase domain-containing protein [Flavobacterium sp.]